ncbi:flagellar biosynthesis protein FlhA [Roseivivax sp. CAU 1753]
MSDLSSPEHRTTALEHGLANRDVAFAIAVTLILGVLFVPLPPAFLDFGLAVSLSLSVLILMVALWIQKPLEFNSFPTLLLVVTMLRLSLNVASTRLILSEGHTGSGAAGGVIEGFSRFIVAGSFAIGIVIFIILVVINFIVITKGSTRIAEVSARFSLDAMPGKQMAIDADLGAGLIDEKQAQARRRQLENESSFFGAMDGASKFVRGDAVAGIIITLVNVVGGILIGILQYDMSIGSAASAYTTLTIGDGLVSQVPALIVSLAAGLIVTKGGTIGATNEVVLSQLGRFPKALYMSGALLILMGLLPGFPLPIFALLAVLLAGLGVHMQRVDATAKKTASDEELRANIAQPLSEEDALKESLKVDALCLELGSALIPLSDSGDAALPGKIKSLRGFFAREYGFVLPTVRIRDESSLALNEYRVLVHGVEAAKGEVRPTGCMVLTPDERPEGIAGTPAKDPTFGLEALWVDAENARIAEDRGLTVVDPESVLTTHLTEIAKDHMAELVTFSDAKAAVDRLDRDYQKLLTDLSIPNPVIMLERMLQSLLAERISVRNLPLIIEAIAEATRSTQNERKILDHVRQRLSKQICSTMQGLDGFVPVIGLSPPWERELLESLTTRGDETTFTMSPKRVQDFLLDARREIQSHAQSNTWPAILVSAELRGYIRSMLERVSPATPVLSHAEVHRKALLRTVGQIGS